MTHIALCKEARHFRVLVLEHFLDLTVPYGNHTMFASQCLLPLQCILVESAHGETVNRIDLGSEREADTATMVYTSVKLRKCPRTEALFTHPSYS